MDLLSPMVTPISIRKISAIVNPGDALHRGGTRRSGGRYFRPRTFCRTPQLPYLKEHTADQPIPTPLSRLLLPREDIEGFLTCGFSYVWPRSIAGVPHLCSGAPRANKVRAGRLPSAIRPAGG